MYRKYFCSFADSRMKRTLDRVKKQAKNMEYFDEIFVYTENDLKRDFKILFKKKLVKGTRGFGYWVWKPQVILQVLSQMNDGDVLVYMDAGCHLNKNGLKRLDEYCERARMSEKGLCIFQEALPADNANLQIYYSALEKFFTKGDLFEYFGVRDRKNICDTGQIAATAFVIKKCREAEELITEWLSVFQKNFSLADDSRSISPNFEGFVEHRHDQSIFSLLCKMYKIEGISAYEMWQSDWKRLEKYPIHAKRDKDLSIYWRGYQKIRQMIIRLIHN